MLADNNPVFILPEGIETRWASYENPKAEKGKAAWKNGGRKGSDAFSLKSGESFVLAEESGRCGIIRRIWVTISDQRPVLLRGLRLDFYWDGSEKSAVSAPLGDFFGTGLGRITPFQSALFSSPEGKSFTSYIPMPFKKGMKMVVTNESPVDLRMFYYDIDYTIGDELGDNTLYFHAHYRRENPTKLKQDYEILPKISGAGRYLGANLGVIVNKELYFNAWWGEGECKIYLDGDTDLPTLSGTGTEDYIGTGWGQGRYDHMYQGCQIADRENNQYCFYRYHIPDPVYFRKDIRVTIQQLGCWGPEVKPMMHKAGRPVYLAGPELVEADFSETGIPDDYGLFERQDDWSSCVYFYLDEPVNSLPPIDPADKRIEGLFTDENVFIAK